MKVVYITYMYNPDTKIESVTGVFETQREAELDIRVRKTCVHPFVQLYYKKFVELEDEINDSNKDEIMKMLDLMDEAISLKQKRDKDRWKG